MIEEKILIVEDDRHLSKLLKYNLDKAGFSSSVVESGEDVFHALGRETFHLIILDVMLPKMDGFEVCKKIRQDSKFQKIPIVMLTARGEEIDRIVGLEIGADDYVVKPFSPRELILRVKGLLRRSTSATTSIAKSQDEVLVVDDLKVDISRHKVTVNNKEVNLTSMEFKLLETLIRRQGRVQTRDQLLNDVWDLDAEVTTRTIDTHVKRLRQKLGKMGDFIETVRGHGYRFYEGDE